MNKLLIIGLDPGTTIGYAVLDVDGNDVLIGSSRNMGISEIIDRLIPLGSILLVGTDKSKIPGFVEKFSANNRAKIVSPRHDLSIEEKRNSIRDFGNSWLSKTSNDHEVDALASAIFAYKSYSFLFKKIKKFAEINNVKDKENAIIKEVVMNKVSMREALSRTLSSKFTFIKRDTMKTDAIISVPNPLNELRRRIRYLEEYNEFLKNNLAKQKDILLKLKLEKDAIMGAMDIASSNKARNIIKNKNYLLNNMISENKKLKKKISDLDNENSSLKNLVKSKKYTSVLKIENLGKLPENIMNLIKNEEILFVNDPSIISSAALEQINPSVIIYKKKPTSKIDCMYIRAEDICYVDFQDFVLVNKKEFEQEINKKKALIEIVDRYKNRFKE